MPKASGKKSEAAKRREAKKRGENPVQTESIVDPSILSDPDYQPQPEITIPTVPEPIAAVSSSLLVRKIVHLPLWEFI